MKKILLFTAAILLTLASCTKNGNGTSGEGAITVEDGITSVKKMNAGGEFSLNFKADCDWEITVTEGADWMMVLEPAEMSGAAGEYTLEGYVDPFNSDNADDVRSAQITIKAKSGDASVVIEVVQTAGDGISSHELTFPKEGGEQELTVETVSPMNPDNNDGVHFIGEIDWAEIKEVSKPENGIGVYKYNIIVKENTTGAERTAGISACYDGSCKNINLIQKGE